MSDWEKIRDEFCHPDGDGGEEICEEIFKLRKKSDHTSFIKEIRSLNAQLQAYREYAENMREVVLECETALISINIHKALKLILPWEVKS